MIITIRDGGPSGEIVYSESHSSILTSEFGLINLVIGGGDATEGSFGSIPWSSGNIWYEIEVDSGAGLESLGASQFLSVPYALFAGNAEESLDNDPTNELIDSAGFDPETQSITIQESENQVNFSLEGLDINDGDPDATNELISAADYNPETNAIILTQADGSEVSISLDELNVADNDPNPENELIDPESGLELIDTFLRITEAGIPYSVNLASLADDEDWTLNEEESTVFNENQKIGIGTTAPDARLEVVEEESSQVALNVQSGDKTLINAVNERIGVGTDAGLSSIQFGGSVGYDVTVLNSQEVDSYNVGFDDHMIVINFQNLGNDQFGIFLPPANVCEGRVYLIRKTGAISGDVTIDTGGFDIDFSGPNLVLDENNPETAVLLSLGSDGWTRILREN